MEDTEPRKVADSRNETVNHESLHQRNGSLVDENTKNIELDCGNCYNEINGAGSKSGECYSKDTVEKAKDFRFLMCHSTFNCRFCGNCFPNARKLKHHVITIHKCLKPYKCSRCLAAFCDARRLYYHMVTHTKPVVDCHHLLRPCDTKKCKDNENIKCSCCHKVFNSKASLIMHLKNRNGFQQTGTYKCVYCSGSFVSPYELDRHISVHKKYRCPHCKTCFSRLLLLKKHKCNSLEEGKESCDTLLMVKGSQKRKKQLVKSSLQETKGETFLKLEYHALSIVLIVNIFIRFLKVQVTD